MKRAKTKKPEAPSVWDLPQSGNWEVDTSPWEIVLPSWEFTIPDWETPEKRNSNRSKQNKTGKL